jgi:hypothetical protein
MPQKNEEAFHRQAKISLFWGSRIRKIPAVRRGLFSTGCE